MCDFGNLILKLTWEIFPLNDGVYANYVRRALELYPFYSQCILIPGMAFERFLLVCRPVQAALILKNRYRFVFYIGTSFLALLIPSSILLEYFWFHKFNYIALEKNLNLIMYMLKPLITATQFLRGNAFQLEVQNFHSSERLLFPVFEIRQL